MTCYLGIDPGDRWNGWAHLMVEEPRCFEVECGVLDAKDRHFVHLIQDLTRQNFDTVVVERFQLRAQGHQRFHNPMTAKVIGALAYAAGTRMAHFEEVNPADPAELDQYPIAPHIRQWRSSWPDRANSRWQHALSAWRVLCAHFMTKRPELLWVMQKPVKAVLLDRPLRFGMRNDLMSTVQTWRFRA